MISDTTNYEKKVAFTEVRAMLHAFCSSSLGHERVDSMRFLAGHRAVCALHSQLAELRLILQTRTEQPRQDFIDLRQDLHRLRIEGTYLEEQTLWELLRALHTLHDWIGIVQQTEGDEHSLYPALAKLSEGVFTFFTIVRRIEQVLDKYGHIKDDASQELRVIRSELHRAEGSVSRTLQSILRAAQANGLVEKDAAPAMRNGRLVIPVAPALKRHIRGIVHDESATGKTVFIEPAEVVEANNRIRQLEADERREIIRILQEITELLRPNLKEFLRGFEFLADIDFLLAKSRFTDSVGGISPHITAKPLIDWTEARHPLLDAKLRKQGGKIVPLDITLNARQHILVISGPNAGGKSVCLKTVGLLQYMLQCGLPVPMADSSNAGIFQNIFIDIGDEQSIEEDLSTYSSHLLCMKRMMANCTPSTLLLIDEFGSGTEPTIGGAMAEAMLRRFVARNTFGIITTHYQNLKRFAQETPGVVSGAMLYDRQKMAALFKLQIGHPGSSFAVEIARKIGIPEEVIADATELVGREYINADKYLLDITRDKQYWEGKRQTIHSQEKQMQQTIDRYVHDIDELKKRRSDIIYQAKREAEHIIATANAQIENTIREIREAQAEKDRTRIARQQLQTFREKIDHLNQEELDAIVEKKRRQIEERRMRHAERQAKKAEERAAAQAQKAAAAQKEEVRPICVGDSVRIKGQTSVGTVTAVEGKQATVTFGVMRTMVELKRLEHSGAVPVQAVKNTVHISRQTQDNIRQKHLNFKQEIDVRGMRADDALQAVSYFIDDALLVSASRVRILHGTGTGALRMVIRQYLDTVPGVKSARDEHVQFGGAGITVVEL